MQGKLTCPFTCARGAARALPHLRAIACVAEAPCECDCPSSASRCSHGRRLCAALRLPSPVSSLINVLATSLTASCLLCQITFGSGPDQCSVSRAFSCVVQLCGYFFAMFLC